MKKKILLGSALTLALVTGVQFWGFSVSSGPPDGHTGAPSEPTCAKSGCHHASGQANLNSGSDGFQLRVEGNPEGFVAGQTYKLIVEFASSTAPSNRHGFQLTALDPQGNAAGSFRDTTAIQLSGRYAKQTSSGNTQTQWVIPWVAPQQGDRVTFYAAGNATNNNFSPDAGDNIYTDSLEFSRQPTSLPTQKIAAIKGFKAYPNPLQGPLQVEYQLKEAQTVRIELNTITGQTRLSKTLGQQFEGQHQTRLQLPADLPPGNYFLVLEAGQQVATRLLYKE